MVKGWIKYKTFLLISRNNREQRNNLSWIFLEQRFQAAMLWHLGLLLPVTLLCRLRFPSSVVIRAFMTLSWGISLVMGQYFIVCALSSVAPHKGQLNCRRTGHVTFPYSSITLCDLYIAGVSLFFLQNTQHTFRPFLGPSTVSCRILCSSYDLKKKLKLQL